MKTRPDRPSAGLNPPPACFAVSRLPSLASPQVPASRTTLSQTPLFEVSSAKVGSRHFVLHQHVSWGPGHHLCGSPHSDLDVKCIVTAIRGPRNGPSKYLVRVPSLRLRDSSDVRRPCLDRQPLLGDNHCFRRPSSAFQRILQDAIAVPIFPLLLAWPACTKSSLRIPEQWCYPFGHAASEAASSRRYRHRTASSSKQQIPPANTISFNSVCHAMFQCSLQCSHLTCNEPHSASDDPIGLAFPHWRSLWNSLAPFLACLPNFPCQRFNRWLVVASKRDCVVPELINELRCSLCDPGELRSFPWNQHCPRHLVSPFADDQHKRHLLFRFSLQETRSPSTRAGPFPSPLEHLISCAVRSPLVPSRRTCTMICTVDVWSCALGAP